MSVKVDSWDYKEAIKKVDNLLSNIACKCADSNLQDMPSAVEIVDIVIDTII